jgi:hypothetical protein
VTNIDKQRVDAVRKLEQLGYRYDGGEWVPPASAPAALTQHSILAEADALLSALVLRADALEGCIEGSEEEAELAVITDAIEAYEAVRWPAGKVPGGKGRRIRRQKADHHADFGDLTRPVFLYRPPFNCRI